MNRHIKYRTRCHKYLDETSTAVSSYHEQDNHFEGATEIGRKWADASGAGVTFDTSEHSTSLSHRFVKSSTIVELLRFRLTKTRVALMFHVCRRIVEVDASTKEKSRRNHVSFEEDVPR